MAKITFTDDELREAAIAVRDAMLASIPAEEDCPYEFSPGFEERIRQLYQAQRIWGGQVILPFADRLPGDPHALRQLPLGEGSRLPKICNSLSN